MFFGGGMLFFWLLIAAVVVLATGNSERVMEWFRRPGAPGYELTEERDSAEEILRRRYAQGEISREEYLERQEVLAEDRQ